jgi:hypothetical protein
MTEDFDEEDEEEEGVNQDFDEEESEEGLELFNLYFIYL